MFDIIKEWLTKGGQNMKRDKLINRYKNGSFSFKEHYLDQDEKITDDFSKTGEIYNHPKYGEGVIEKINKIGNMTFAMVNFNGTKHAIKI